MNSEFQIEKKISVTFSTTSHLVKELIYLSRVDGVSYSALINKALQNQYGLSLYPELKKKPKNKK